MDLTNISSKLKAVAAKKSDAKPEKKAAAEKLPSNKVSVPAETFQKSEGPATVKLSYNPQDPGMMPVATAEVPAPKPGLANERFKVSVPQNFPSPKPDENGNYLFRTDDPRFDSVNSYFVANRALEMAENYAGREIPWSFEDDLGRRELLIHPHAGGGEANAFYIAESGSINFFHYKDEASGEMQRTGMQTDVVAHETGHAILDALRPMYMSSLSVASGGFHESFGDMIALLSALNDNNVLDELRRQTKGDLSQPNIASGAAEQLGQSAYGTPSLREAINDLKYSDQHFLPYVDQENPAGGLGTEAHAYSNLFTGAFYEVFHNLYDQASQDSSLNFAQTVGQARDTAGQLLLRAVEFAPVGDMSYKEMALAFVKADMVDNGGANVETLVKVFADRKIITEDDLGDFLAAEEALPQLKATRGLEKKEKAEAFLETHRAELGLPKDVKFEFEASHKNESGERFVLYSTHRDTLLDDPGFGINEGGKARVLGGHLLAFDKSGELIASNYDAVTDRELEDVKNNLKTATMAGAVTSGTDAGGKVGKGHVPKLPLTITNDGSGPVIQRARVVFCGGGCSGGGACQGH